MKQTIVAAGLATTIAAAVACGGGSSTSNVVAPTGTVVTDVFPGVVQPLAFKVHTFTVTTPGQVTVTMTAAGPPPTIAMGLGIGNPDASGNCIFLSGGVNNNAVASATTPQLSGAVTASGSYCVEIADIGNAAGPITYSITVVHT